LSCYHVYGELKIIIICSLQTSGDIDETVPTEYYRNIVEHK